MSVVLEGFETSRAFNMNYFYFKILDDYERDRVRHLEQFDEFEVMLRSF